MFKAVTFVAAVAFAVPALAQVSSIETSRPRVSKDPNEKICERITETGSRLASKRVCMTSAEWAAQKTDHRNDVERAQKNVGIINQQ
ncbi:hypothetical protein [Sphingomonas sp. LY160]|uniref:hypothetical protein n=1 Tax=Sphingomonas sp. LY160 TaxID=3095342 RepID=UPI002ADEACFF|nr:hypothetical protein [Sphingomonas sp. LY160]MEA1072650.1 hypothetical protein [Sphingomonas sp. LY160]